MADLGGLHQTLRSFEQDDEWLPKGSQQLKEGPSTWKEVPCPYGSFQISSFSRLPTASPFPDVTPIPPHAMVTLVGCLGSKQGAEYLAQHCSAFWSAHLISAPPSLWELSYVTWNTPLLEFGMLTACG